MLSDFQPKGAVAASYGMYLAEPGITDRATVIIDAGGIVRHASSVTPAGERNIAELASLCEGVDRAHGASLPTWPKLAGLAPDSALYIKSRCGFSRAVLLVRDNLHLQERLPVHNVSEDPAAMQRLRQLTGKEQAPCFVENGRPILESAAIISHLVESCG